MANFQRKSNFEGALEQNGSEFFHDIFYSWRKTCKKYDEMKSFASFYFILILETFKHSFKTRNLAFNITFDDLWPQNGKTLLTQTVWFHSFGHYKVLLFWKNSAIDCKGFASEEHFLLKMLKLKNYLLTMYWLLG